MRGDREVFEKKEKYSYNERAVYHLPVAYWLLGEKSRRRELHIQTDNYLTSKIVAMWPRIEYRRFWG